MDLQPETIARVVGPTLAAIIGLIGKAITTRKPKVVSWTGHISVFQLGVAALPGSRDANGNGPNPAERGSLHGHSIHLANRGGKTAKQVRVSHYVLPPNISVYPPVPYSIERNPQGAADIVFPVLVPKEHVEISYLYDNTMSFNTIMAGIRSDEGLGKVVNTVTQVRAPMWLVGALAGLAFVGASFLLYLVARCALLYFLS